MADLSDEFYVMDDMDMYLMYREALRIRDSYRVLDGDEENDDE